MSRFQHAHAKQERIKSTDDRCIFGDLRDEHTAESWTRCETLRLIEGKE